MKASFLIAFFLFHSILYGAIHFDAIFSEIAMIGFICGKISGVIIPMNPFVNCYKPPYHNRDNDGAEYACCK